ncbi:MAG: AgmX/PglI C-terminal domain-containing protein [Sandaracinaceae bacterium]|nr:AgmX/PglI C-terminal domain-containing protein [Sandaracinaceae bacterium]
MARGCAVAGAYATDAGEHDEARDFALRACALGDYDTCARLAETTDATTPDGIETLRRLLFAACFRGEHLRSCVRLAEALEDGPFATDTANEAGVAWEQACRLDRRYCSRVPPPRPPPVGTDAGSASLYAEPSAPAGATAPTTGERGGSLSADVIRTVVRANRRHVQACYETALARWSALRGTVTVRFIIQPDGTVSTATVVSDTVGDAGLRACITASIVTWRFPAPDGGGLVSVTYPFTLEST